YGNGVTKFGVNYGGGIKVKVSPMFAVRFDVRDYLNPKPFDLPGKSGWLHMLEAAASWALIF
ncbi:MAG: hypothetical protein ACRD96_12045, partial [Bryobacteraceae bacterium]